MPARWILLGCLLLLGGSAPAVAQETKYAALFTDHEVLDLELMTDLRQVLGDRRENRPYQPATLTYRADGNRVALDIRVKTRGNFRLHHLDCDVPPLRLNFKQADAGQTLFEGQSKLKLVTHCFSGHDGSEQRLLQEYLAYRIYNLLTVASFRVRLVRFTYVDTREKRKPETRYAFLIEDANDVAERLAGRVLEVGAVQLKDTDPAYSLRLSVFQYLIGNTDWSVPARHNIEIVYNDQTRAALAVPYDFDWAGLVDAPYAKPREKFRLNSVRDRLYLGYCRPEAELTATFARFNHIRDDLRALFESLEPLDASYARRSLDYIDAFYTTINTPDAARRTFQRQCLRRES